MGAVGLLFSLFLVVLLGLVALGAILAALQGLALAFEADPIVGWLSIALVFPVVLFGVIYWVSGNNLPQKFMDDLREKQQRDEGQSQPPPEDHHPVPEHEPDMHDAGGDFHDNVDHALVGPTVGGGETTTPSSLPEALLSRSSDGSKPIVSTVTEGDPK